MNAEAKKNTPDEVHDRLAEHFKRAVRWTRVNYDLPDFKEIDFAELVLERPHCLLGYASLDGTYKELIWDSRAHVGPAPVVVRGTENGELAFLRNVSGESLEDFPLRAGVDRVLVEMSPARAGQLAREWFDRVVASPVDFAELQKAFTCRDEAIAHVLPMLKNVGDVTVVNNAMLAELRALGHDCDFLDSQMQDKVEEALGGVDLKSLTPDDVARMFAKLGSKPEPEPEPSARKPRDLADRVEAVVELVAEVAAHFWPETVGTALPVAVTHHDKSGKEISIGAWLALHKDNAYCILDEFSAPAKSAPEASIEFCTQWLGLGLHRLDTNERRLAFAVHMRQVVTTDPVGHTEHEMVHVSENGPEAILKHAVMVRRFPAAEWERQAPALMQRIRKKHSEGKAS